MRRSGLEKPMGEKVRATSAMFGALLLLSASFLGCAAQQAFQIKPKSCVNPMNGLDPDKAECVEDEQDSRPLELRFYPLSSCPEESTLKWEDLLDAEVAQTKLKDFWLEDPEVRVIERLQDSTLERNFPRRTRCFLVVAIGRAGGPESMEVVKYRYFHRDLTVTVERYNLFVTDTM